MKTTYQIQAITPIFSYGAYPADRNHDGSPEIRAASIRGQLRWWMENIGFESSIDAIFGSTANNGHASKIVVRVDNIEGTTALRFYNQHKRHNSNEIGKAKKKGYKEGTRFQLHLNERYGGLDEIQRNQLLHSIEAWMLMGSLGSRGTRGAGSLTNISTPYSEAQWCDKCAHLLSHSKMHLRLGQSSFRYETEAREIISDTLAEDAFHGAQPLGGIHPRKTSPLRMRVVRFSDADPQKPYRIAALWTEASEAPLEKAIQTLKKGNGRGGESKPIGAELENAFRIR
jgi:CRISPR type III-B/RAMP module RAMP protein Cmr1